MAEGCSGGVYGIGSDAAVTDGSCGHGEWWFVCLGEHGGG